MVIPAPGILSFTALARKDSGLKTPYPSVLRNSGPLKGIIVLVGLSLWASLENASSQALILEVRKSNFACVGLSQKTNGSKDYLEWLPIQSYDLLFSLVSPLSYTHP